MSLENIVQWTRGKLSLFTNQGIPVSNSTTWDSLTRGAVSAPLFDLFGNENEVRLMVDAPGATTQTTHLTWNDVDTLVFHVARAAPGPGTPYLSEYRECDWYCEIALSPDVDGSKAKSTVRDGVVTVRLPKRQTFSGKLIPVYAG